MRYGLIFLLMAVGCSPKKAEPDRVLPGLKSNIAIQYDSLGKVKLQVLKYANLYVNDINNKMNEDSMEYWSQVQQELQSKIAATKYSIDSLNMKK